MAAWEGNKEECNEFYEHTMDKMDECYEEGKGYIVEANEEEFERACSTCKYYDRCNSEDLFYGCGVWEVYMGDDL